MPIILAYVNIEARVMFMGSLAVIPLMGFLGILFITLNLIVIALIILTIVFGIIRIIKEI